MKTQSHEAIEGARIDRIRYNRILRRIERRDAKIQGMQRRMIHLECLLSSAQIQIRKLSQEKDALKASPSFASLMKKLAHCLRCHKHDMLTGEPITWEDRDEQVLKEYSRIESLLP